MSITSLFQYFVMAGLINTALFAILLLIVKRNKTASILLIMLMLLISFQALLNGFDTKEFFLANPHLSRISLLQLSLFGPLIYLFVKKFTAAKQQLAWKDLVHLTPFVTYLIILSPWFFQSSREKRKWLNDVGELSRFDFEWLNQVSVELLVFYLILSGWQLKKYRRAIENTFSDISRLRLTWLEQFLYFIGIILCISALGFYGRKWEIPYLTQFYQYSYAVILLMLYWLAYKFLAQPDLIHHKILPSGKYGKSGLTYEASLGIYEKLLYHMKFSQPYLDPELTIYKLAEQLNIPGHHLKQVINERTERRFFDFINNYRVEAVKSKLTDPGSRHLSIPGIALECGFSSKATFHTTFRKFTDTTPSAYQKSWYGLIGLGDKKLAQQ